MKKLVLSVIALMVLSFIMGGCAGIPNLAPGASEGGMQSSDEMLPLLKFKSPVKQVNIFSCTHLRILFGPKLPVQLAEGYNRGSQDGVKSFFKASDEIITEAGFKVKIENLPSANCYDLDNIVGGESGLTLMVVFFSQENVFGYQTLKVQGSIIPPGRKGRYFSQRATINGDFGPLYSPGPIKAAIEVMQPIIDLLKSAESAK